LIGEYNGATGAVLREYAYVGMMAVAVFNGTGAGCSTSYIHSGHRYEPLVMTSQSKTKVWEASVRPYGKLDTMGAVSASNDFRLLGQWHHLEAAAEGLSQNHYRDYDPSIGRYIQADPLGYWGGQSLYAYVDGRPYDDVDPTGQCPWCVAALINAGFDIASQMLLEGKSFECIDWASVAFSALPLGKLAKWAKPLKKSDDAVDIATWSSKCGCFVAGTLVASPYRITWEQMA
jgi:RHS repeat-associated protein